MKKLLILILLLVLGINSNAQLRHNYRKVEVPFDMFYPDKHLEYNPRILPCVIALTGCIALSSYYVHTGNAIMYRNSRYLFIGFSIVTPIYVLTDNKHRRHRRY